MHNNNNNNICSDNSYRIPLRTVSHTDTHSTNSPFYDRRDLTCPLVYFTPNSPDNQLPVSDDNLSNVTHSAISETDFHTNSKFTNMLLKPKNVFKESDAYRHLTRVIRPRGSNMRGALTNSDGERTSEMNSFVPSDTNSEEDPSHYRFMQNRNVHNIAYHSQDKEKFLDLIKSDLERVKGEFREVKTGHNQLNKSVEVIASVSFGLFCYVVVL